MKKLAGKKALVTGAGREKGIGFACALSLAREGADLIIADLPAAYDWSVDQTSELNGRKVIEGRLNAEGVKALTMQADVTNPESVETLFEAIREAFGGLDILVNNAGTAGQPAPLVQTDLESWRKTIEVNLTGTMLCSRAAAFLMMDNPGGGKIINMSSRAARRGAIWIHAYCASKAGVIGLTRSMALELASFKICVNALCPGDIDTELKRWGWEKEGLIKGLSVDELAERAAGLTPLGRIGTPQDVASAVVFLASPDSDYLTGEVINITGGNN